MWYAVYITSVVVIGVLAFYIGRKLAGSAPTESKTSTFLIKSIQAIAELAVLEYITEGVAEIKQKNQPGNRSLEKGAAAVYSQIEARFRPGQTGLYGR